MTEGEIAFDGAEITDQAPEERSRSGLFMAFQYPVAIPGVTVAKYLRMALNAHREARGEDQISLKDFRKQTEAAMELMNIPREFSSRYVNDGFSGGEKKRLEILQLAMLRPGSRSSTKPIRGSTSTRCGSSPRASTSSPGPRWGS